MLDVLMNATRMPNHKSWHTVALALILILLPACRSGNAVPQKRATTFQQANQAARKERPAAGPVLFGLKPGEGRALVISNCIGCHSPMLIAAHRLDRRRWEETLTTMKKHGLWTLPANYKNQILEYLVAHQGPLAEHEAKDTPWAQPRYRPNPLWK